MTSVVARVPDAPHELLAGVVLPIAHYPGNPQVLEPLGGGGALYLVERRGPRTWLVAVLESPERGGPHRPAGWYAAPNEVPVVELRLRLGRLPRTLDAETEAALRAEIGADEDDPLLARVEVAHPPPVDAAPHALLERGHAEAAIAAMLSTWRAHRNTGLADAIVGATRWMSTHDRPLADRRNADVIDAAWHDAFEAGPEHAMPQLLQTLPIGFPSAVRARLARLASLPDDPRIARRLAEIAGELDHDVAARAIVDSTRDRRASEAFYALILADTEPPPMPEPAVDVAAIDAALARLDDADPERALVDAIGDHPDDLSARRIYADWLLGRAHPRGEYIALACEPRLSGAKARRLAALADIPFLFGAIDDLATTWYRPQDRGIDRELAIRASTSPAKLVAAARHPLVRLLDQVAFVGDVSVDRVPALATFVRAAVRLRRVDHLPPRLAGELARLLDGFTVRGTSLIRLA